MAAPPSGMIASPVVRPSRWFAPFVVTTLLALQYGLLAVWPAWRNDNSDIAFVVWIALVGIASSLAAELLCRPLHFPAGQVNIASRITHRWAKFFIVTGFIALFGSAMLGASTYATQLGADARSPLAALFTPFTPWAYIGCAFLLYCFARGDVKRGPTLCWLGASAAAFFGYSLYISIIAPFASFAITLAVGAVLAGLFKPRWLLIGIIVGSLAWPIVYDIRNTNRAEIAASGFYGQDITAEDRLREDLLVGLARDFPQTLNIGQPTILDVVRYGLVPRAIDPLDRPEVATGRLLNAEYSEGSNSSLTFTILANIRALGGGTITMITMIALLAAIVSLLSRTVTPVRLAIVMAIVSNIVWIESNYPECIASVLQAWVAYGAAMALVAVGSGTNRARMRVRHGADNGHIAAAHGRSS